MDNVEVLPLRISMLSMVDLVPVRGDTFVAWYVVRQKWEVLLLPG